MYSTVYVMHHLEKNKAVELKDMGSLRGFSATRGTLVALEWQVRSKHERSAQPTISIQPYRGKHRDVCSKSLGNRSSKIMYWILQWQSLGRTYIRGERFSIPAVTCVVSHLVFHVLTEAHFTFGKTHFKEIQVNPSNEVAQHRVVDDSLLQTRQKNTLLCHLKMINVLLWVFLPAPQHPPASWCVQTDHWSGPLRRRAGSPGQLHWRI